ncbi:hypothetical protein [uncultured Paludibaculum sp.]|uniref:hypothetical protein n=1 Tax=uncultured Paludibaculum sp. TaxID=1765020 RepID=UPI002AAA6A70|nr:hypothetical protein [uncultured Paludibaculum sp.]
MWPTALIACGLGAVLFWQGLELKSKSAPQGIVSLELAASAKAAEAIIDGWRADHPGISLENKPETMVQQVPKGKDSLALNLTMFDFLFLLAYPAALSMSCVWLARKTPWPDVGLLLGWVVWLAALLDAVENTLLIRLFNANFEDSAVLTTRLCALGKFLIFLAALGFTCHGLWRAGRKILSGFLGLVWAGTLYSVAAALVM